MLFCIKTATFVSCRWRTFVEGGLCCIDMSSVQALGPNLSFTRQRYTHISKCYSNKGYINRLFSIFLMSLILRWSFINSNIIKNYFAWILLARVVLHHCIRYTCIMRFYNLLENVSFFYFYNFLFQEKCCSAIWK